MNMIKCPHCGEESPTFDYAHVCMKGPYAVKLPKKPELEETEEEREAWAALEKAMLQVEYMSPERFTEWVTEKLQKK